MFAWGWWIARVALLVLLCCVGLGSQVAAAERGRVDLEIATQTGLSPEVSRDWLKTLQGLDLIGLRIRQGKTSDMIELKTSGSGASATHRVSGAIMGDGTLRLPGGRFRQGDRAGVAKWLDKLQQGGEEGLTTKPAAFGLLPRQLVEVHEALAAKVGFSTLDKSPREVVDGIADRLTLKLQIDSAASRALNEGENVSEEVLGLSSGTALAAVLRPLGLVLVPQKAGASLELRVADSGAAAEHWPVGWPSKKPPKDTLPDLYKFLNVEVKGTPVGEAVEAVRGRLNVPLLIDQNSLARQQIDMQTTNVALPKTNTFYSKILDRLLFEAKLKYELRVDEAEQPFLWITTLKQ